MCRRKPIYCVVLLHFMSLVTLQPCRAQISYRSLQAQHAPPQHPTAMPRSAAFETYRFLGWKYAASDHAYRSRFQRLRGNLAQQHAADGTHSGGLRSQVAGQSSGPQSFPGIGLRPSLPSGFIPDSMATGDFNGDGETDWVVANGGDNNLWVYLGNGDGT